MTSKAYPMGIVKYDIKYNSIYPNIQGKLISKEPDNKKSKEKYAVVYQTFQFT